MPIYHLYRGTLSTFIIYGHIPWQISAHAYGTNRDSDAEVLLIRPNMGIIKWSFNGDVEFWIAVATGRLKNLKNKIENMVAASHVRVLAGWQLLR